MFDQETRRVLKESTGTFVIAIVTMGFAIALTYLEDFCHFTHRPLWLCIGIKALSIVMFVTDGLVILRILYRVILTALKGSPKKTDDKDEVNEINDPGE